MTSTVGKVTEAIRARVPPLTSMPLPRAIDRRLMNQRWPVRELAAAPAGSGLKPVLGDDGAPLIGHSLDFMRFGVEYALRRYDTYGPVSWMGAFGRRIVNLSGPAATQIALVNTDKAFSQDGWKFFIENFLLLQLLRRGALAPRPAYGLPLVGHRSPHFTPVTSVARA
jgi:hypothetical protein